MTPYKPSTFEKPRNLAILLGVAAALSTALCGSLGFSIGSRSSGPIVILLQQPLTQR